MYVGYQYQGCDYIFWETRSTTVNGYDLTASHIGGWNLDIHHMYNYQEGNTRRFQLKKENSVYGRLMNQGLEMEEMGSPHRKRGGSITTKRDMAASVAL